MKTLAIAAGALFALLPLGCPSPAPPRPMPPDATDAMPAFDAAPKTACMLACQQLAMIGCAEGAAVTCVGRLSAIDALHAEPNRAKGNDPLQCGDFAAVKSAANVVAMGQRCTLLGDR
jgi:hypothetical protein